MMIGMSRSLPLTPKILVAKMVAFLGFREGLNNAKNSKSPLFIGGNSVACQLAG